MSNRLRAHGFPVTLKTMTGGVELSFRAGPGKADGADGSAWRPPFRAGNAGDGQRPIGVAVCQGTQSHGGCCRFAHGTVRGQGVGSYPEKLELGFIRVGYETALEPSGTSGDGRQALPNPATGAGFRGRQALAIGQQQAADFGGKAFQRRLIVSSPAFGLPNALPLRSTRKGR